MIFLLATRLSLFLSLSLLLSFSFSFPLFAHSPLVSPSAARALGLQSQPPLPSFRLLTIVTRIQPLFFPLPPSSGKIVMAPHSFPFAFEYLSQTRQHADHGRVRAERCPRERPVAVGRGMRAACKAGGGREQ